MNEYTVGTAVRKIVVRSLIFFRASIRQRSRSQLSNVIPDSSVSISGDLSPTAYSALNADKSKVCVCVYILFYAWVIEAGQQHLHHVNVFYLW